MQKIREFMDQLSKTNIRSILAILTLLLGFGTIFFVLGDHKISTEEIAFSGSVTTLMAMVFGYYFGTSKDDTDKRSNTNKPQ